jgi:hypothetical protein
MAIPLTQNKMIRHCFENITEKDDNLLKSLKRYNSTGHIVKEKKQEKQQPKTVMDKFNLRAPNREYYTIHENDKYKKIFPEKKNMYENINKMFKGMLDLQYIFQNHQEGFGSLHSSEELKQKLEYY